MDNDKLTALAHLYMEGKATEEEQRQLHEWYDGINKDGDEEEVVVTDKAESENETGQRIFKALREKIGLNEAPVIPIYRQRWRRAAAAAAVLLMVSVGGYFIFKNKGNKDMAETEPQEKRFKNDVAAPKNSKATITLADGSTVALDSAEYGKLATQGNVNVMVTADGRLVYKEQGPSNSLKMQYNTLSNPKGSKVIDMTLTDGSRVWLNAGSSVTYPVAFVGNERKVSITGEAYFEVTHNAAIPFKVSKGEIEITDLGTSFNVNAYDDEVDIKVTLLEGSVKISRGSATSLLKPGQQGVLRLAQDDKEVKVINGIDLNEVMAWKNGKFSFEKMDIESIMRQMARWYNVDVEFKDKIADKYTVKISRDVPVSQVFKFIEMTGGVHFEIDGNKVVVRK